MTTLSHYRPGEPVDSTAADRAAREAASTFAAIMTGPPSGAAPEMVAWSVLRAHVTPYGADDETAAIVRAVLAELRRWQS